MAALYEQMMMGCTFHPGGLSHSAVVAQVMNYASVGLLGFFPCRVFLECLQYPRPYKRILRVVPHDREPEVAV